MVKKLVKLVTVVDNYILGRGILCGGSIVSTRFILTAAHCVDKADKIRVYFGVHKLSQAARIWKDVDEWIKHPDYKFPKHDIALMKITPGIKYSNNIKYFKIWQLNFHYLI